MNIKVLYYFFCFSFLFLTKTAYAQIGLDPSKQSGRGIKLADVNNPDKLIGDIFKNTIVLFFTIGALGFIIMFLWGTVDWILSGGDKDKIAGARKRIVTAITGLTLLSLTFAASVIIGHLLGIEPLRTLDFPIPKLTN